MLHAILLAQNHSTVNHFFPFSLYSDHPFQVRCQQKIILVENGPLKLLVGDQDDLLRVERRGPAG